MREIKFRCWRDGYMCKYYDQWRFVENGLYWEERDADPTKIGKSKPILMQYIGIKDKHGKEIFQDDIVKWTYRGREIVGRVIWDKYKWNIENFFCGLQDIPGDAFSECTEYEIIGNFQEHPHLLPKE